MITLGLTWINIEFEELISSENIFEACVLYNLKESYFQSICILFYLYHYMFLRLYFAIYKSLFNKHKK